MKEEIEIKVFLKNPKEFEANLLEKAIFIKEINQKDEYFTPKHKDFFAQIRVTEYPRIRYEYEESSIGYHFCHTDKDGNLIKTDEYETKIKDPKMMSNILKKLEMAHKVTVIKRRKIFDYKDFLIFIDRIKNLGCFVEIEAKNIKNTIHETKKECYNILNKFGAIWVDATNQGYPDMIISMKQSKILSL